MAPHSSTLSWKIPWTEEPGRLQSMGLRRVGQNWVTSLSLHFPALEKEMATHSSVLAWRIPGTGEPGGLLSMGLHRAGYNWSNLAAAVAAELGRSHGVGNGNPTQYSCLENDMDRRAWWATVHGAAEELDITECTCTAAQLIWEVIWGSRRKEVKQIGKIRKKSQQRAQAHREHWDMSTENKGTMWEL